MFHAVLRGCLDLLTVASCELCRQPLQEQDERTLPCRTCRQQLSLPSTGLQGSDPLPFWALGWYRHELRSLLLRQRREPQARTLRSLARALRRTLPASLAEAALVAIPSWKRRGNPLPLLICEGLGLPRLEPLRRSRPTLGQHHLNRRLRALNQAEAFTTLGVPPDGCSPVAAPILLLVDDILTTGATASAAADALRQGGYRVAGLACLARTPAPGRDLGSAGAAKRPAGIAQLVEQATENRRVPSSNLGPGILL